MKLIILLLCLVGILCSCASPTLSLKLLSTSHLNQDAQHHSLPVLVRVYTLTQTNNFTDATFRELWHDDKSVLNNTLVDSEEYTLNPNTELKLSIPVNTQANYIGVVALFRHPEGGHWRAIHPIPNRLGNILRPISIKLTESKIIFN